MLKHDQELPVPSLFIQTEDNEQLSFVPIWVEPIRERVNSQAVKKTLTIPKWLNDEAEKQELYIA